MKLKMVSLIVVVAISATNAYANAVEEFALEDAALAEAKSNDIERSIQEEMKRLEAMAKSNTQTFSRKRCADVEKKRETYGYNSLTGLVLVPVESNKKASPYIKRIVFSPYFDMKMSIYSHKNDEFRIFNLEETDESIVFYDIVQKMSSPKRKGKMITLKKLGDDKYELKINRAPQYVANMETYKWETKWKYALKLDTEGSETYVYQVTEESKRDRANAPACIK